MTYDGDREAFSGEPVTLSSDTSASGRTGFASSPGASVEGDAIADGARIARRRECVGAIILAGHEEANRPFLGTPAENGSETRPLTEKMTIAAGGR